MLRLFNYIKCVLTLTILSLHLRIQRLESIQLGFFNVHIQSKLLQHIHVMSTQSSHTLVMSWAVCLGQLVSSNPIRD